MDSSNLIGSAGVFLLLLAFSLNLVKWLDQDNVVYLAMNLLGAALACAASWMIGFIPFVILEIVWCLVALFGLARQLVPAK